MDPERPNHRVSDRTDELLQVGGGAAGALAARILAEECATASEVEAGGRQLVEVRPTMAPVRAAVAWMVRAAEAGHDLAEAADSFEQSLGDARRTIADEGPRLVEAGQVVLTHCYSGVVLDALRAAWSSGRRFEVVVTETRPMDLGRRTAKELAEAGIPVTLIADSAAYHVMRQRPVGLVLLGADTIAADGTLYNKVGTAPVCLAAAALGIEVVVLAETAKTLPPAAPEPEIQERPAEELWPGGGAPDGVRLANPAYDATRPELVSKYVTERGTVAPTALASLHDGAA